MAVSQLVSRASISVQFLREPTPPALSPSSSLQFPILARTKSLSLRGSVASRFPRTAAAAASASATAKDGFLHCFSKDEDGFLCCEGVRVQDVIERICLRPAWMEALQG